MRKAFWLVVCALLGMFYACDTDTMALGMESIPESDQITVNTKNYKVTARSLAIDSVLARTSTCYLGNFTDEETGSNVQSDFIVQFNCTENYSLQDTIMGDSAYSVELCMYFDKYVGDSLAPCRVSLYPLTKTLDNTKLYYTNVDPKDYYDESAGPIATKTFTMVDRQQSGSEIEMNGFRGIHVSLPTSVGTDLIRKYKKNPSYFANSEAFQKNVNKGYYVKFERGEGVMARVYVSQFNTSYRYFVDSRLGVKDSLVNGVASFSSTEEVVQANKIVNTGIQDLLNDTKCTYIKSPSGIFTELTLPVDELANNTDTINSAKLILSAYNNNVDQNHSLSAPANILMVKKSEMNSFFDKYKTPNDVTSYLTSFGGVYLNTYTFNNICHLVTNIKNEMTKGMASDPNWKTKNPDWNKVVLIPVTVTYDSQGAVSMVQHNLDLSYVKLRTDDIQLQVIFSKYKH